MLKSVKLEEYPRNYPANSVKEYNMHFERHWNDKQQRLVRYLKILNPRDWI